MGVAGVSISLAKLVFWSAEGEAMTMRRARINPGFIVLAIGMCQIAPVGCERSDDRVQPDGGAERPTMADESDPSYVSSNTSDLHDQLRALTQEIADPLALGLNTGTSDKDLSQLLAEIQDKSVRLSAIARETRNDRVRFIATECSEACLSMARAQREMVAVEENAGLKFIFLAVFSWITGNPSAIVMGMEGLIESDGEYQQQRLDWLKSVLRYRSAQLMLPSAAEEVRGALILGDRTISIDLDESFAGSASFDLLRLRNESDSSLTNCTIAIEVRGDSGSVARNVHYVDRWNPHQDLYAKYGIGIQTAHGTIGRQTVYGVREVEASIWTDQGNVVRLRYIYRGSERDRDVQQFLAPRLRLSSEYQSWVWIGVGKSVDLAYHGIPLMPQCEVTIWFERGSSRTGYRWVRDEWAAGRYERFDTGRSDAQWDSRSAQFVPSQSSLGWDPETITVEIRFPACDYCWSQAIKVTP